MNMTVNSISSPLKSQRLQLPVQIYIAVMLLCAITQIGIGSDVVVDAVLLVVALTPAFLIDRRTIWVSDLMYFSCSMYFGGLTLVFKTLLWQTLQSNLESPEKSAIVLALGYLSVTVFYIITRYLRRETRNPLRHAVVKSFSNTGFLKLFARVAFAIGFVTQALQAIFKPVLVNGVADQGEGFGGFGIFYFLLIFAIAAQLAIVCMPKRSVIDRNLFIIMLLSTIGLSVLLNVKKVIIDSFILFVFAIYAYRIHLKPTVIVLVVVSALFVQGVMAPLIHLVRAEGTSLNPAERIEETFNIMKQHDYNFASIYSDYEEVEKGYSQFRGGQNYYYPSTLDVSRFSLIFPTDEIVRADTSPKVSYADVADLAVTAILPSFVAQHKSYTAADLIAWNYNIDDWGVIGRPVIGPIASCYAMGGIPAVLLLGGLFYCLVMLMGDFVFGVVNNNVPALSFSVLVFSLTEYDIGELPGAVFRDSLFAVIAILGFSFWYLLATQGAGAESVRGRARRMLQRVSRLPSRVGGRPQDIGSRDIGGPTQS